MFVDFVLGFGAHIVDAAQRRRTATHHVEGSDSCEFAWFMSSNSELCHRERRNDRMAPRRSPFVEGVRRDVVDANRRCRDARRCRRLAAQTEKSGVLRPRRATSEHDDQRLLRSGEDSTQNPGSCHTE